jgi:hypothetical protein
MYGYPMMSNYPPARLTPAQEYLTRVYRDCTFKYRLANAGGSMFDASTLYDAMGELERLFNETMKEAVSGTVYQWS